MTQYAIPPDVDSIIQAHLADTISKDTYRESLHAFAFAGECVCACVAFLFPPSNAAEEHAIQGRLQLCTLIGHSALVGVQFKIQDMSEPLKAGPHESLIFIQLGCVTFTLF